jgi:hypothetical protein
MSKISKTDEPESQEGIRTKNTAKITAPQHPTLLTCYLGSTAAVGGGVFVLTLV